MSTFAWTCDICGVQNEPVYHRLIEWRQPIGSVRFEHVTLCMDEGACRIRVAADGAEWPIFDQEDSGRASTGRLEVAG